MGKQREKEELGPALERRPEKKIDATCLRCSKKFKARDVYNRLCPHCLKFAASTSAPRYEIW